MFVVVVVVVGVGVGVNVVGVVSWIIQQFDS